MMSKWVKKILVFVLLGAAGISFGISGNVSALDKNTILAKAVYQGVYNCAKDGAYAKEFSLASSPNGFYANKKAYEIELPYYFTQFNYNTANCKQIMSGDGQGNTHGETRLKGLLPVKYVAFNWNAKEAVDYFTGASHDGVGGIGYKLKDGQVNDKGALTGFNIEVVKSKDIPMDLIKGLNNNNGAGLKLANVNSRTDLGLTQQESFDLFSYYLIDVFKVPFACEGDQNYNNYSGLKDEIKIGGKTCKYKLADAKSPASYVFGVNDQGFFSGKTDANAVFTNLKQMAESGNVKTDELGAVMAGADTSSSANGDSDNNDSEPTCEGSGAGASLGWVLCPILNRLSSAAEGLYNFVAPYLEINPKLFTGDDVGVRAAWETFRNMANVLFIIVLLVVIFSQVTGVGIDNYGIKKVLPKIIVAAVLINLSYLICLIFVDLSNILGNGLLNLFNGLPSGEVASEIEGIGYNSVGKASGLISLTLITAFGAGALVALISNPAILLSLLVAALGIVIAIFFLFVLLSARQVAIVVLIVLSPLAFACMMLPNMKKLFSKWLKMSEGMLLLYPICGLLIGASNYVSKLMMANENVGFVTALVSMLVGIVPIFFIPTLLTNSFAALGNLGSKISSWGNKMRGGATGRIRSSEGFKNAQKLGLERRNRMRVGSNREGNLNAIGRLKANMANSKIGRVVGSDRRFASRYNQVKKTIGESEEAGAMLSKALARTGISESEALWTGDPNNNPLGDAFGARSEGAYYGKQFLDAARAGRVTDMNAAISAMTKSGMKSKDIAKLIRYAQNGGMLKNINEHTRSAWMRDMVDKYGNDFLATDLELKTFMVKGGSDGTLGDYGQYAMQHIKISDINPDDVSKLSSDGLAAMIASGKLDQSMANTVLAKNPNLSADKRIMLGAAASGNTDGVIGNPGSVKQFKEDADALAGNHALQVSTINSTKDRVDAWTSNVPQDVNVVQNFQGGGRQIRPVDVNLRGDRSSVQQNDNDTSAWD